MFSFFKHKRRFFLPLLGLLCFPLGVACATPGQVSQEYQLKAAFLFNFARFITWPKTSLTTTDENINFCIIGENPFGTILTNLESKKISGHFVKVHYLEKDNHLQKCHLAFYGKGIVKDRSELDWEFSSQYILTISDISGFAEAGGDIEFTKKNNRIRFIISNSNLKRKGLTPRASLLELAAEIR